MPVDYLKNSKHGNSGKIPVSLNCSSHISIKAGGYCAEIFSTCPGTTESPGRCRLQRGRAGCCGWMWPGRLAVIVHWSWTSALDGAPCYWLTGISCPAWWSTQTQPSILALMALLWSPHIPLAVPPRYTARPQFPVCADAFSCECSVTTPHAQICPQCSLNWPYIKFHLHFHICRISNSWAQATCLYTLQAHHHVGSQEASLCWVSLQLPLSCLVGHWLDLTHLWACCVGVSWDCPHSGFGDGRNRVGHQLCFQRRPSWVSNTDHFPLLISLRQSFTKTNFNVSSHFVLALRSELCVF